MPRKQVPTIKYRWIKLDKKYSEALLHHNDFDKQRNIRSRQIQALSALHRDDRLDGRAIHIVLAVLPDGEKKLINGQHCCWVVVNTEKPLYCTLEEVQCNDLDDVIRLYRVYDTQMKRTYKDALKAAGIEVDLQGPAKTAFSGAVQIIHNRFAGATMTSSQFRPDNNQIVEMCDEWLDEALVYSELIETEISALRNWYSLGGVMAVGLITIREQRLKAEKFWTTLTQGVNLHKDDPIKLLRDYILSYASRKTATKLKNKIRVGMVAKAWNYFYNDRNPANIRAERWENILIQGTSFEKTEEKQPN